MNSKLRRELRASFDEWSDGLDFEWALGLAFNRPCTFQKARKALKSFALVLDRVLLGPKCLSKGPERTLFIAVPEHPDTNFHYHALVKIRAMKRRGWLELVSAMTQAWAKVAPGGSLHLEEIRDQGAARYAAKDLVKRGHFEEFIISTEFYSEERRKTAPDNVQEYQCKEVGRSYRPPSSRVNMKDQFELSELSRRKLSEALERYGCKRNARVATQMEALARKYDKWMKNNPEESEAQSVRSINEADRIIHQSCILHSDLDSIGDATYRRMDRERRRGGKELSSSGYKKAVSDIRVFAEYARERGCEQLRSREIKADSKLLSLVTDLIVLWTKGTRRGLPKLPDVLIDPAQQPWSSWRELERHPLWIILAALGMRLTCSTLSEVISAASTTAGDAVPLARAEVTTLQSNS